MLFVCGGECTHMHVTALLFSFWMKWLIFKMFDVGTSHKTVLLCHFPGNQPSSQSAQSTTAPIIIMPCLAVRENLLGPSLHGVPPSLAAPADSENAHTSPTTERSESQSASSAFFITATQPGSLHSSSQPRIQSLCILHHSHAARVSCSSSQPRSQSLCILHHSHAARVSAFFITATQPESRCVLHHSHGARVSAFFITATQPELSTKPPFEGPQKYSLCGWTPHWLLQGLEGRSLGL
jgi:hypothetical protein